MTEAEKIDFNNFIRRSSDLENDGSITLINSIYENAEARM